MQPAACSRTPKCRLRPARFGGREVPRAVEGHQGLGRGTEVRGPADQPRHVLGHLVEDPCRSPPGPPGPSGRPGTAGSTASQPLGKDAALHAVELVGEVGVLLGVPGEQRLPVLAQRPPPCADAGVEVRVHLVGHQERLVLRPAVEALGAADLLLAERLAVGAVGALLGRRTVGDPRVHDDQRGSVGLGLEPVEGPGQHPAVVGVPTRVTFQPRLMNLVAMSSLKASAVLPSIVISLLS